MSLNHTTLLHRNQQQTSTNQPQSTSKQPRRKTTNHTTNLKQITQNANLHTTLLTNLSKQPTIKTSFNKPHRNKNTNINRTNATSKTKHHKHLNQQSKLITNTNNKKQTIVPKPNTKPTNKHPPRQIRNPKIRTTKRNCINTISKPKYPNTTISKQSTQKQSNLTNTKQHANKSTKQTQSSKT